MMQLSLGKRICLFGDELKLDECFRQQVLREEVLRPDPQNADTTYRDVAMV